MQCLANMVTMLLVCSPLLAFAVLREPPSMVEDAASRDAALHNEIRSIMDDDDDDGIVVGWELSQEDESSFDPTSSPSLQPSVLPTESSDQASHTPTLSPNEDSHAPTTVTPDTTAPTTNVPTSASTTATTAFSDLIQLGQTVLSLVTDGNLDTGYTVTEVEYVFPPDSCGVVGGDGSSCVDICGVTNGDNSTSIDVCGEIGRASCRERV